MISCRLSRCFDFASEWFGVPCSNSYWKAVTPVFNSIDYLSFHLSKIRNKDSCIYIPLLQAFIDEINYLYTIDNTVTSKIVKYFINTNGYYEIKSKKDSNIAVLHTFEPYCILNKPCNLNISALTIPEALLPTELIAIQFKSGSANTVEMYLNNGWQLSFSIHTAGTMAEASLQLEIQLIGIPVSLLNLE